MGFYGMSSIICQFIVVYIVNPNNIKPDDKGLYPDDVIDRLPDVFIFLSLYFLFIGLLGCVFINEPENSFDDK